MKLELRPCPLQRFRAECGQCGFAVDGEIRNGWGGWKSYPWDEYSRCCTFRTARGVPTMACPHLRKAQLAARPLPEPEERIRTQPSAVVPLRAVPPQ